MREESVLRESRLLSGALREAAARNRACFADSGNWEIGIAFDGVHFLPEGHRAFAERLLEILESWRVCAPNERRRETT